MNLLYYDTTDKINYIKCIYLANLKMVIYHKSDIISHAK